MKYMVQATDRHVLTDYNQVRRGVTTTNNRQNVRVREYSKHFKKRFNQKYYMNLAFQKALNNRYNTFL